MKIDYNLIKQEVILKTFKLGSLFAGVGGIDLGFLLASKPGKKFEISFANEIDSYASITYRHNFKHNLLEGDIQKILSAEDNNKSIGSILKNKMLSSPIDVLTAGFPCQAFSIAGERRGFEDERGNLFWSIIDTIKLFEQRKGTKPRILFLENVKNLKSHDGGRTFKIIKDSLQKNGYFIKEKIINTALLTELPQNRERIFILGFANKDDYDKFNYFENIEERFENKTLEEKKQVIKKIINYDGKGTDSSLFYTKEKYPNYFNPEGIDLESEIKEPFKFYQVRRGMYVRDNKNNVCPTLTANMGTGGHNVPLIRVKDGIRKLSPEETFLLQGFPIGNGYNLPKTHNGKKIGNSHFYKQAGNAVSVDVIKILAEQLLEILD